MKALQVLTALAIMGVAGPSLAQDANLTAPPGGAYQRVSDLVPLPAFLPGLGELWVDPATLPAGPFLAYDRGGQLVATIFMIPIADLEAGTTFDNLPAPGGPVDHIDVDYNVGHPGVEAPHAHVVLWRVPVADEARVAE
jgi:hypothetical protein